MQSKLQRKCASALVALALSGVANAQLVGVVVGVPDGDTVAVAVESQVLSIDLRSVDAPEVGQPYGGDARASLAELCDSKTIVLDDLGVDRGRRIIGDVHCGGVDAGEEQVRRGLAWAKSRPAEPALRDLQAKARAEHKGLWSDAAPVPPWEWSAIFTQ
jgi:endonuclease YncB( thermonuclease family)